MVRVIREQEEPAAIKIGGLQFAARYTDADTLLNDMFRAASSSSAIMYRGISYNREIYPKIMRVWDGNSYRAIHYTKEIPMLKELRKYGASLMEGNYGAVDFVSCAQHFGIPTRLLDWSFDPFVALYFAIFSQPVEADGFAYRVCMCDTREQLVFEDVYFSLTYAEAGHQSTDLRVRAYEDFIDTIGKSERLEKMCEARKVEYKNKLDHFVVLETNNSNPRISAQKGLFVIPKSRNAKLIRNEYKAAGVQAIRIDAAIRGELLEKLEKLGYTQVRLFFDLQNICTYIRKKALQQEGTPPAAQEAKKA